MKWALPSLHEGTPETKLTVPLIRFLSLKSCQDISHQSTQHFKFLAECSIFRITHDK